MVAKSPESFFSCGFSLGLGEEEFGGGGAFAEFGGFGAGGGAVAFGAGQEGRCGLGLAVGGD